MTKQESQADMLRRLAAAADRHGQHIYTHWRDSNAAKANEEWQNAASPELVIELLDRIAVLEARQAVQMLEPVTWLIERGAFRVSPGGQDAESHEWLEEADEPGQEGSFAVYTEQQVLAMLFSTPPVQERQQLTDEQINALRTVPIFAGVEADVFRWIVRRIEFEHTIGDASGLEAVGIKPSQGAEGGN